MASLTHNADAENQGGKGQNAKNGQQNHSSAVLVTGRTAGALRRRSTIIHNEDPFLKKMEKQRGETPRLSDSSIPHFEGKNSTLSKILEKGKNL
jgi:hypothetical protein